MSQRARVWPALALAVLIPGILGARPLPPDGFITTWSLDGRGGRGSGTVHTWPSPEITLQDAVRRVRPKRAVRLRTRIRAERAGTVWLKVGCTRRCEVSLAGQTLVVDSPYAAWIDDKELAIPLTPGEHTLELRITPSGRRHSSFVRLHDASHDTNHQVPDWVSVAAPGEQPAAVAVAGLPVRWEKRVHEGRFEVTAIVGPGPATELPVQVRLGEATRTTRGEVVRVTMAGAVGAKKRQPARVTLSAGGVSRTETTHYRAFAPAVRAIGRAREVLARVTPESAGGLDGAGKGLAEARSTVRMGADHLEGLLAAADRDTRFLSQRADALTRQTAALERGTDPLARETGPVMRAYRSALDGRDQVYALYVPPSWKPGKAFPLVVTLHPSGFHPLLALRIAMGEAPAEGRSKRHETRHLPTFRDRRAFVVAPGGYRGTGSRYFGKTDVLEVIERVCERYGIDRSKITLSGGSLGGLGSFHIGLRMPDRFNGIMPMAGYGSVMLYKTVRGLPRTDWEPFLVARRDNVTFVENAKYLPMLAIHGARDNPRRSRVIVDAYRKYGYRHAFEVLEDVGHNAWDPGYADGRVFRFNRAHRRPANPPEVRFVSGSYHHREAYWTRIDQFEDHGALGRIRARRRDGRAEVSTENLRRLTLTLPETAHAVVVDGDPVGSFSGPVSLRRHKGHWQVAQTPIPNGEKRPGLSGPIDDVRYTPHVFVYGTADPAQTETNRRRAEHAARYWWNDADIHMPVVADVALDPDDARQKNLVLFGNPTSNRVLARIADRLPVRFEANALVIGERRFDGPSVGTSFIYPNPETAGQTMVVVHAGVTRRGTWLSAWLPRWLPDIVVYDDGISMQRGGRLMDRRKPLWGGNFDRRWQPIGL